MASVEETFKSSVKTIFDGAENLIKERLYTSLDTSLNGRFAEVVSALETITATFLVAWIIYEGFQIAYGRSNKNAKDFMWDAFLRALFAGLALNAGGWVDLVKDALSGIREFTLSNTQIFTSMSEYAVSLAGLAGKMYDNSSIFNLFGDDPDPVTATILTIFVFLAIVIANLPILKTILLNTLSLFALGVLTPLVFFCLVFGMLKNVFKQWLEMIISNFLTLLIVGLFVGAVMKYFAGVVNTIASGALSSPMSTAFECLYTAFVIFFVNMFATSLARNLTQVSIEGAASSAMTGAAGLAGATAGAGLGITKMGTGYMKNTIGRVPSAIQGYKDRQKKIFNLNDKEGVNQ